MQKRQQNRRQYFDELAMTSEKYYLPYIQQFKNISAETSVLEAGCGDGGNLLPFSRLGCGTVGVDISRSRIHDARMFFAERGARGEFTASDILGMDGSVRKFDIVICHDCIEHIADKRRLLAVLRQCLKPGGLIFMSFPAWQMPFGGHQQICRSRLVSHLPFIHLLPSSVYKGLLMLFGEDRTCVEELMNIRRTRCTIERFEQHVAAAGLHVLNRRLYFVNPHYEVKFGLRPRILPSLISGIPVLRNYFTTSCFYILTSDLQI